MQDYCIVVTEAETGIEVWNITQELDDSTPLQLSAEIRSELKFYAHRIAGAPAHVVNGWSVEFTSQLNDGGELSNEVPRGTLTIVPEPGAEIILEWRAELV